MVSIEQIEELAKRRGFFWQSSEIYGGASGFYDYGHIGTLVKRRLENLWRKFFLSLGENFFEIDATQIMPEKVFQASGHLESFVDPVAKCKKCGTFHRADHILEDFLKENFEGLSPEKLTEIIRKHNIRCPKCKGELAEVSVLNMMFPLTAGGEAKFYLLPETAQGAFVNFLQEFEVARKKLPLGLAIIGRAFRNEISPRQLTTRMREFTQAELQIFFDPAKLDEHENFDEIKNHRLLLLPADAREKGPQEFTVSQANEKLKIPKFYLYHMAAVQNFFLNHLQIPKEKFRFKELNEEERAFYNKLHWDIELNLSSIGWKEIGGVHYRTDHDLAGHTKVSGKSHEVFVDEKKFLPHVLELSFGIDRIIFSLLDLNYTEEKERKFLRLPEAVAPFAAGVFPLVNKDGLDKKAEEIFSFLKQQLGVFYDSSGSIGRRYARADEIGVPYCITIDHQTLQDNTATVRFRDSAKQERVQISSLLAFLLGNNMRGKS